MRPFIALILVAAALGAFYFAFFSGGDSTVTPPKGLEPNQPAAVTPTQPEQPAELEADTQRTAGEIDEVEKTPEVRNVQAASVTNELTGLIVNKSGSGIEGASVTLTRFGKNTFFFADPNSEGPDRSGDVTTTTDKEGRYRFTKVEAFDNYALRVRHPDYGPHEENGVKVGETGLFTEPLIMLSPGVELHGLVSDIGGNPVIGAKVVLAESALGQVREDGPDALKAESDGTGRYSFKNLGTGNWTMVVSAEGYGRVTVQQINIAGDAAVERDVVLQVAQMIGGRVMEAGGDVIAGAKVQAFSLNQRSQQTRSSTNTDKAGDFVLEDIPSGTYTLLITKPGYKGEREQRVEAGEMNVLVELLPLPKVTGRVVMAADNSPLANYSARLREQSPNSQVPVPVPNTRVRVKDAEGLFEIACPKPGTYVVEASADGLADCYSEPFTISDGQNLDGVQVRMTVGGTIVGKLVDSQGEPVRNATITTHDNDWTDDEFMRAIGDQYPTQATSRTTRSGRDGSFELKGLSPAPYLLHVKHAEYADVMQKNLMVSEGGQLDAGSILLNSGGVVTGTVYDPAGQPLAGAVVQMQAAALPNGNPVNYSDKTDSAGRYTIKHVRAGTYNMSARRTAGADGNPFQHWQDQKMTARQQVVADGQTYEGVDFRIGDGGR